MLAVSAVITDSGKVLLIKRGHEPALGLWSLPGGSVEKDESLHDALMREVREETSLHVDIHHKIFHQEIILSSEHTYDLHTFVATVSGGILSAGDDAADAKWYTLSELEQLDTTPRLSEIVALAFEDR